MFRLGEKKIDKKEKKKVSLLQIGRSIIKDKNLSATDFTLYAYLKMMNSIITDSVLVISRNKLMDYVKIIDKRTLTKSIENLIKYGAIFSSGYKSGNFNIALNKELFICESDFAQLPTNLLINFLEKIDHTGFRLLYYYESFINRSSGEENMFCYPSYEEITRTLGISDPTLTKYNKILEDNKLLRITKHFIRTESTVKNDSLVLFKRYNNHYTPQRGEMHKD